jgi:hypothetical protein
MRWHLSAGVEERLLAARDPEGGADARCREEGEPRQGEGVAAARGEEGAATHGEEGSRDGESTWRLRLQLHSMFFSQTRIIPVRRNGNKIIRR